MKELYHNNEIKSFIFYFLSLWLFSFRFRICSYNHDTRSGRDYGHSKFGMRNYFLSEAKVYPRSGIGYLYAKVYPGSGIAYTIGVLRTCQYSSS